MIRVMASRKVRVAQRFARNHFSWCMPHQLDAGCCSVEEYVHAEAM